MASNISVEIYLEEYLKSYVMIELSENDDEPVILKKNSNFRNFILPFLISKREYEHLKIVEKVSKKHNGVNLAIMLPWKRGKIDIRVKHFVSPNSERKIRKYLKSYFYLFVFGKCVQNCLCGESINNTIFSLAETYNFIEEPHYESVKRNIYRMLKNKHVPFANF